MLTKRNIKNNNKNENIQIFSIKKEDDNELNLYCDICKMEFSKLEDCCEHLKNIIKKN